VRRLCSVDWTPNVSLLARLRPDVTDVVDINHVPDQMRIFDTSIRLMRLST
jgi:hypothetical protein